MATPATLPATYSGWDDESAPQTAQPGSLPADFKGWDAEQAAPPATAPRPAPPGSQRYAAQIEDKVAQGQNEGWMPHGGGGEDLGQNPVFRPGDQPALDSPILKPFAGRPVAPVPPQTPPFNPPKTPLSASSQNPAQQSTQVLKAANQQTAQALAASGQSSYAQQAQSQPLPAPESLQGTFARDRQVWQQNEQRLKDEGKSIYDALPAPIKNFVSWTGKPLTETLFRPDGTLNIPVEAWKPIDPAVHPYEAKGQQILKKMFGPDQNAQTQPSGISVDRQAHPVLAAATDEFSNFVSSLTSPQNLAIAVAGPLGKLGKASDAINAVFMAQMAKGAYKSTREAEAALRAGNNPEAARAATDAVMNGLMLSLGAAHPGAHEAAGPGATESVPRGTSVEHAAAAPESLPADFTGWDQAEPAAAPEGETKAPASETHPPIGETEPETGRTVLQQSPRPEVSQAAATAEHPAVKDALEETVKPIAGAEVSGAREEKAPERVEEKIAEEGQSPRTMRDFSGFRVAVDSPEAKTNVENAIRQRFEVPDESDEFANGNEETGFHGHTMQVREPGSPVTHEVQILPREVAENADERHPLYEKAREGDQQAAAELKAANQADYEKFIQRNAGKGGRGQTPEQPGGAEPKFKFGSTQANIPEGSEAAQALKATQKAIAPDDRAGDVNDAEGGLVTQPHVTVRYGIRGDDVEGVKRFLEAQAPFEATLGKTSSFPASESSDGAVPIVAPVESPELNRINAEMEQHGDFEPSKFPEYKPHATLGYVKPGTEAKYVGMDGTAGKRFRVDSVAITDRNGNQIDVPLKGAAPTGAPKTLEAGENLTANVGNEPNGPGGEHAIREPGAGGVLPREQEEAGGLGGGRGRVGPGNEGQAPAEAGENAGRQAEGAAAAQRSTQPVSWKRGDSFVVRDPATGKLRTGEVAYYTPGVNGGRSGGRVVMSDGSRVNEIPQGAMPIRTEGVKVKEWTGTKGEKEISDRVRENLPRYTASYLERYTQDGVPTIATDAAKELFPEFRADPVNTDRDTAAGGKAIRDAALQTVLAEPVRPGKDHVLVTTASPGSGKTTSQVFDGTDDPIGMKLEAISDDRKGFGGLIRKILDSGRTPVVEWVYVDEPGKTVERMARRAVGHDGKPGIGRTVQMAYMKDAYYNVPRVIEQIRNEFGDRVKFRVIDNSGAPGEQKYSTDVDPYLAEAKRASYTEIGREMDEKLAELEKQGLFQGERGQAILKAARATDAGTLGSGSGRGTPANGGEGQRLPEGQSQGAGSLLAGVSSEEFKQGLDQARKRSARENAAAQRATVVEQGGAKAVVMDPDAYALWHRAGLGEKTAWRGVNLPRSLANKIEVMLRGMAGTARSEPGGAEAAAGYDRMVKAFREGRQADGSVTLLRGDYRPDTLREEAWHVWQGQNQMAGSDAVHAIAQSPEVRETAARLEEMGYGAKPGAEGRTELAMEMMAKVMAGDPDLHATAEQQTDMARRFAGAILNESGPRALDDLPAMTPEAEAGVAAARREYEKESNEGGGGVTPRAAAQDRGREAEGRPGVGQGEVPGPGRAEPASRGNEPGAGGAGEETGAVAYQRWWQRRPKVMQPEILSKESLVGLHSVPEEIQANADYSKFENTLDAAAERYREKTGLSVEGSSHEQSERDYVPRGIHKGPGGRLIPGTEAEEQAAFDEYQETARIAYNEFSSKHGGYENIGPTIEGERYQRAKREGVRPEDSLLLPGMEGADEERARAAGEAQGAQLTEAMRAPKGDISEAAGRMERESPLFKGTGENPLLFQKDEKSDPVAKTVQDLIANLNEHAPEDTRTAVQKMSDWAGEEFDKSAERAGSFWRNASPVQKGFARVNAFTAALVHDMTTSGEPSQAAEMVRDALVAGKNGAKLGLAKLGAIDVPRPTDWEGLKGDVNVSKTENAVALRGMVKAVKQAMIDPDLRAGVKYWIEANGDPKQLKEWAEKARERWELAKGNPTMDPRLKDHYRKSVAHYEAAAKMTPEQTALAQQISDHFKDLLEVWRSNGLMYHAARAYVNHLFLPTEDAANLQHMIDLSELNPDPSFIKKRVFATYFEAENHGLIPRNPDIAYLLAAYDSAGADALATRTMLRNAVLAKTEDGKPLALMNSVGRWVVAHEDEMPQVMRRQEIPESVNLKDYKEFPDLPQTRGFLFEPTAEDLKGFEEDPKLWEADPTRVVFKGNLYFHRSIADEVEDMMRPGWFDRNQSLSQKVGHRLLQLNALSKEVMTSLIPAPFHLMNVGRRVAEHWVNPFKVPEIDMNDRVQRGLVAGGLQSLRADAEGLLSARMLKGIFEGVPGLNVAMDRVHGFSKWLFEDYIPRAGMAIGIKLYEHNRELYLNEFTERAQKMLGPRPVGVTPEAREAAVNELADRMLFELSAKQANASVGVMNTAFDSMPRSKTAKQALRLIFFAPEFLESTGRYVGQGLAPHGRAQRIALVRGLGMIYLAARGLNAVFNKGDAKWDRRHAFSVVVNGKEYSMRGAVEDLVHAARDPRQFAMNRLAAPFSATLEFATGRNYYGRQRTFPHRVVDAVERSMPFQVQKVFTTPDISLVESMLGASGIYGHQDRTKAEEMTHEVYVANIPDEPDDPEREAESRRNYQLESDLRNGKIKATDVFAHVRAGEMSTAQAWRIIRRAQQPRFVNEFASGGVRIVSRSKDQPSALDIFAAATPQEKMELRPVLAQKAQRQIPEIHDPTERAAVIDRFQKLLAEVPSEQPAPKIEGGEKETARVQ